MQVQRQNQPADQSSEKDACKCTLKDKRLVWQYIAIHSAVMCNKQAPILHYWSIVVSLLATLSVTSLLSNY